MSDIINKSLPLIDSAIPAMNISTDCSGECGQFPAKTQLDVEPALDK